MSHRTTEVGDVQDGESRLREVETLETRGMAVVFEDSSCWREKGGDWKIEKGEVAGERKRDKGYVYF